ncbi:hypothetical protein PsorP6_007335 [Peronosclerospora sorghi]|uniref:Uncharacterized protein n=1 Tax=Peronosclerospora sorghi TaxID=230839 RepID=A0ACC0W778_9STRA|nr:hypothetical protein PsorP6_007335 [Peronosclerospora sorghi]
MKLLPEISTSKCHDFATVFQNDLAAKTLDDPEQKRFVHQLKKLMETKSVEVIEDEDEQVQADIFSFLQQPSNTLLTSSRDNVASTCHPEHLMRDVLRDHQNRAKEGFTSAQSGCFSSRNTASLPCSRFHVIPMLSCAFKRFSEEQRPNSGNTVNRTSINHENPLSRVRGISSIGQHSA